MNEWSVLLLAFVAAACACANTEKQGSDVFGREPSRAATRALRAAAWAFVFVSYVLAIAVQGVGIGSFEWICLFGLAAIGVGVLVAYRPRWLPRAGVTALAAVVGLAIL